MLKVNILERLFTNNNIWIHGSEYCKDRMETKVIELDTSKVPEVPGY